MGMGGFPIGTQGSVLSLMSGDLTQQLLHILTMKRGIKLTNFL